MAAVKLKLPVIEQGATYTHTLKWLNPDRVTPIDLTGAVAQMQIRALVSAEFPLIELTTENGRLVIDTSLGTITLTIAAVDTTLLVPTVEALYDLEIHFLNGTVTRLVEGKVTIKAGITHG